ncbi:MAG TPA: YlmH/Sll1252 family protein [Bacillota bacterium]|nr:YlmH/Sll1252 family protein [Bacillota bacterium]
MDNKTREKLLNIGQSQEDKLFLAKVLDKLILCQRSFTLQVTDFLDPYRQQLAEEMLNQAAQPDLEYTFSGGYDLAERQRLLVYPDFLQPRAEDDNIAVLEVKGNFAFQKVSHRDFLGSVLGMGIVREKLGDIIVGDSGAQVFADREVADYLQMHLTKVHRVSVQGKIIQRSAVTLPEEKTREIRTTVASLRLDSVAAAGFGVSRTQMTTQIAAEKVKVNWKYVSQPAYQVQEGDIVSIKGRGRAEITSVGGLTKKGRTGIVINRFQ